MGADIGAAAENIEAAMKNGTEAFELPSDFGETAFETHVDQVAKFPEILVATTKEALQPLQGRIPGHFFCFPEGILA